MQGHGTDLIPGEQCRDVTSIPRTVGTPQDCTSNLTWTAVKNHRKRSKGRREREIKRKFCSLGEKSI